jgi:hypothetical protein
MIIPANCARFNVRIRDSGSEIKLAFAPGTSGTAYYTNARGNIFESGDLDLAAPMNIYYQTSKPGMILEWLLWLK